MLNYIILYIYYIIYINVYIYMNYIYIYSVRSLGEFSGYLGEYSLP